MKVIKKHNSNSIFFNLLAVFIFLFGTQSFSQVNQLKDFTQQKYAYENLSAAIKSDNIGVREGAIYLIARYKLSDFEQDLLNQIEKENNPDIKVLIGMALYRIESEKGMQKLLKLSSKDKNDRVRIMSTAIYKIYKEYQISNSKQSASR